MSATLRTRNNSGSALPDYLVIVDFEATCNDSNGGKVPPPKPQEIIEFPAVLLNVNTREVEDEFHHYILPDVHPKLSSFCTELTGITQETVDQGISLKDALHLHDEWIHNQHNLTNDQLEPEGKSQFLYVTCGDWDMKTCLPNQLAYHHQTVPSHFTKWVNIKNVYSQVYRRKARGMTNMLEELGLNLEGRHHSGIDDSRNIARICARLLQDGWKPSARNHTRMNKQQQQKKKKKAQQKQRKEPVVIQDKSQCKTVFLIRHGQSEGQAARKQRQNYQGEEFTDCGLTAKGYKQAEEISTLLEDAEIDLVISSPLRRALTTAVLGFDQDILVHYDLREIGSRIPENIPLPMPQVLKSLKKEELRHRTVDTESLQPKGWPDQVKPPSISKQEIIQNAFRWLYQERPEQCIAVVCHYNVIRSMLMPNVKGNISPQNAIPIKCLLTPDGELVPDEGQF